MFTCVRRERILDATTKVTAEIGYQAATVAKVLARARISKITFYELFDNQEHCFLADEPEGRPALRRGDPRRRTRRAPAPRVHDGPPRRDDGRLPG